MPAYCPALNMRSAIISCMFQVQYLPKPPRDQEQRGTAPPDWPGLGRLQEARFDRHFCRDLTWSRHQLEELAERCSLYPNPVQREPVHLAVSHAVHARCHVQSADYVPCMHAGALWRRSGWPARGQVWSLPSPGSDCHQAIGLAPVKLVESGNPTPILLLVSPGQDKYWGDLMKCIVVNFHQACACALPAGTPSNSHRGDELWSGDPNEASSTSFGDLFKKVPLCMKFQLERLARPFCVQQ